MSLGRRTAVGVAWSFGEQMSRRGIGLVIQLLLARFLVPEDYGLVGMMAVFLSLGSSLMDSGFTQALIRKQGAEQVDFNTAFYSNLALGIVAYILLFAGAPWVAAFYGEPRLVALIRLASLSVVVNSVQVVQRASLAREMNFRALVRVSLPAGACAGVVAVVMAGLGWGVWSLVAQMLLSSILTTLLLWQAQGWRPSATFSGRVFRELYGFGYKLFLSGMLNTVFENIYVIVIAKVIGGPAAGLYFFANRIKVLVVTQLFSSVQAVTYPALAAVQGDEVQLKNAYRKIVSVVAFALFPAVLFLAALAEPLFDVLLSSRWQEAHTMLQLLCLAGLFYPLSAINLNVLNVKGRSDLFLLLEIIKKSIVALVLWVTYERGVSAILYGQIFCSFFAYIPNSYFSSALLGYPLREQVSDFGPSLLLSSVIALVAYLGAECLPWTSLIKIAILGCGAVVGYVACAALLNMNAIRIAKILLEKKPKAMDLTK